MPPGTNQALIASQAVVEKVTSWAAPRPTSCGARASAFHGEIWSADLNPTRGHEQAGTRPALIVSTDVYNQGPAGLVIIVPITGTDRRIPIHVVIEPPEGGVTGRCVLLCDAVRSISVDRLVGEPWGRVSPTTLRVVEDRLRLLMDL